MPPDRLPDEVLIYTLPSRYCLPDVLGDEAWSRFGAIAPGYRRVQAICDHVNGHLTFQYGSTTALVDRGRRQPRPVRGVPRLHPPGDLVLPGAEHPGPLRVRLPARTWTCRRTRRRWTSPPGWRSGSGDRWWTFDPRNNERRKGRVVIGRGRDASDVAMVTTFGGPLLETMTVVAEEVAARDADSALLSAPVLDHRGLDLDARRAGHLHPRAALPLRRTPGAVTSLQQRLVVRAAAAARQPAPARAPARGQRRRGPAPGPPRRPAATPSSGCGPTAVERSAVEFRLARAGRAGPRGRARHAPRRRR